MRETRMKLGIVLASCFELLLLLPIWLVADAFVIPLEAQGFWMAALLLPLLLGLAAGARWKAVWQQWLFAIAVGGMIGFLGLRGGVWLALAAGVMGGFVLLLGLTLRGRLSQTKRYWIGIGLYFAAAVAFPLIPALEAKVPMLSAGGTVCLLVLLFLFNSRFLRMASLANKRQAAIPAAIRSHNAMFMAAIGAFVVVLTAFFGNAFGSALFAAIRWLLGLLFSGTPEEVPPPPAEPPVSMQPPMLPAGEEEQNELWRMILDIAGYVVLGIIVLGILFGIGYWLYKNSGELVREWIKRVLAILKLTRTDDLPQGYTDEETGVFSWETVAQNLKDSWFGKLVARRRQERWEDAATNGERVRFLYRYWLRSAADAGYEVRPALTPKETEADLRRWSASDPGKSVIGQHVIEDLLQLYYRVRYAGEEVSSGEVEKVKRELERNGK